MTTKDEINKEKAVLTAIERLASKAQFETWNGAQPSALSDVLEALANVSFGSLMSIPAIRARRFKKAAKFLKSGLKKIEDA